MATKLLKPGRGRLLALAAMPAVSAAIHATGDAPKSSKVCVAELPIYTNPEDKNKYEIQEEKITWLRQNIGVVREAVWDYLDSMQDTFDWISDKWNIGKAHSSDLMSRLQDKQMMTDVVIITGGGIAGALLGFRGGLIRKALLGSVGATTAASLLYPDAAVEASVKAWDNIKDQAQMFVDGPSDSRKTENKPQNDSSDS